MAKNMDATILLRFGPQRSVGNEGVGYRDDG